MTHIALKNFPLSRDGVKIEDIIKGDPVEVPEKLVDGLLDDGYIALPDAVPVPVGSEGAGTGEQNPDGSGEGSEGAGEKTDASEAKASTKKNSTAKKDGAE